MTSLSTQDGPENEVDDCPICLAPLSTGNQLLSAVCKHGVHVHCAMGNPVALSFFMRNNVCSICRKGPFLAEATLQSTTEWMHGRGGASPFPSTPHTPRWHHLPSPYPPDAFHIAGEWGPDEQDEFEEYQAALAAEQLGANHGHASPPESVWEEGGYAGYEEDLGGFDDDEWAEQRQLIEEEYLDSIEERHRSVTFQYADTESAGYSDVRSLEGVDEEDLPSNQVVPEAPRSTSQGQQYSDVHADSDDSLSEQRSTEQDGWHMCGCYNCSRGAASGERTDENHLARQSRSNLGSGIGHLRGGEDEGPSHDDTQEQQREEDDFEDSEAQEGAEHGHGYEVSNGGSAPNGPWEGYPSAWDRRGGSPGSRAHPYLQQYGERHGWDLEPSSPRAPPAGASPAEASRGWDSEPLEPPSRSRSPPRCSHGWDSDLPAPPRSPQVYTPSPSQQVHSRSWDSELPEPASTSRSPPARNRELVYPVGSPAMSTPQHRWGEELLEPGSPVRSSAEPYWDEQPLEAGSPIGSSPEPYWDEELVYTGTPVGSIPQRQWEDEPLEHGFPMGAASEPDWDPEAAYSGSPVYSLDVLNGNWEEEPSY